MTDTNWRGYAACRGVDPELFFPDTSTESLSGSPDGEAGEPRVAAQVAAAKAVCRGCLVRQRCLDEALERIPYGIAGGLTAGERRRARAAQGLGAGRRPRWRVLLDAGRSLTDVARECGVSVRTVERWAARRKDERADPTATTMVGSGRGSR